MSTNSTIHDDGSGPVVLAEIPAVLPREVLPLREWEDRARLAAHITRTLFTVSPRTLEAWPIRTITVNKRALLNTAETMDYARQQLIAAATEAARGGHAATAA